MDKQTEDDTAEAGGRDTAQGRAGEGVQVDTHREKTQGRRRKPYKQRAGRV